MKRYKWILSSITMLALIIHACDLVLEDEKIMASVDKMPNDLLFDWGTAERQIDGYDKIFTFESNADWCVVSGDKIKVETNIIHQSREAFVNVKWNDEPMKTIRVRQAGKSYMIELPEMLSFFPPSDVQVIELESNTSWTVSSDEEWCTVTPTSGSGNTSVQVSVTDNTTTYTRIANLTFKYGDKTKIVTVSQAGMKFLLIEPGSINASAAAGSYSIDVVSNSSWWFDSSQSWCVINPETGSGCETISVNVSENTSTSSRTAIITIRGESIPESTFNVTQAGVAVVAPSNDQCSGATSLSCSANLSGTTVNTTSKTIPHASISKYGVWYTFTGDGRQTTITVSPASGFDPKLVLFRGSCSNLTYIDDQDGQISGKDETYTFTTTSGTRYYLYIAHYSSSGNSSKTGAFSISRSCSAILSAPTNVKATQNGSTVVVSWNSVSGATGYEVFYSSSSNGTYYSLGTTTGTSKTDNYPYSGANYYKVVAKNSSSTSDYSSYAYCNYTVTPSTGSVTFWTTRSDVGIITVTLNGHGSKQITHRYTSSPSCGASGCATFTNLPYGTYTYSATSQVGTWGPKSFTISSSCLMYLLH